MQIDIAIEPDMRYLEAGKLDHQFWF